MTSLRRSSSVAIVESPRISSLFDTVMTGFGRLVLPLGDIVDEQRKGRDLMREVERGSKTKRSDVYLPKTMSHSRPNGVQECLAYRCNFATSASLRSAQSRAQKLSLALTDSDHYHAPAA